ncbi:Dormancy-associated protein 1 [Arabidopsis thaliana]|uniref:Dormancy-associated protein 1 n=5 Tax=Arabidopsis TaxID=3701 RepID=DRM1_ARATH|nr:dormancy-associated protein-like 1 [Arabidopsis thaliana]NP_849721.1 dormancy-associated protein-like 1 [Arabidopsis thaliana]B9DGG8.1 RecName: Full=Dormancy-associated protein 1; Short=AtDRM1; AltName: Full=Dormancy-associated protein-like 1; Short=AtDYL1 [Arabidopsis thaliana]KAG7647815.1 Dormancy/auxin associated protein [Arabidopsis thaliana x Arabidopsis arenosa]KAG7655742.1 Dormancy/auxin associated protein [Arabidopsis suecica]AEE30955.1 dormancy-associated protein-like 1 [Arabidopsi|eukprot:NP_849720.1 dormancy-associated protein-like 1 [Arabidopsis thaliana]
MVLLEKLWDDVVAGPQPDRGLGRLRKITTQPINIRDIGEGSSSKVVMHRSLTMPAAVSPGTPTTPTTPTTPRKDNVWRSVFNPGSNLATRAIGSNIFDKPTHPNSPSVYDCVDNEAQRKEHVALCLVGAWIK